ncbi:MAG: AAA family ATPase [Humibacillus sp.]|nr:AAA family ATPase [Humibacillus sp.]MDN5778052.1 AAA family ATPase [Humibacillus sp.]
MSAARRFRHGLVIGKFYPFHAGHQALVRAATSSCDRVTVEVMVHGVESIPAAVRVGWVQGEHPDARVVAVFDDAEVDFDSAALWDVHLAVIASHLDGPVDAVFTSDAYGAELARRLGADWVQVDPGRASTPISGTAIRDDPEGNWWALPTPVRRWFTKRVVVLGAESTGSTTLARALGAHYAMEVVPEYGRDWTERRSGGAEAPWQSVEFDLVAHQQAAAEKLTAERAARPLIVCDADVLATTLWHERCVGHASPSVVAAAAARPAPSLYVLTGDEIPFVRDGTREGEHVRAVMQQRFREVLERVQGDRGVPWLEVRGTPSERLAAAVAAVDDVVAAGWDLAAPLG